MFAQKGGNIPSATNWLKNRGALCGTIAMVEGLALATGRVAYARVSTRKKAMAYKRCVK